MMRFVLTEVVDGGCRLGRLTHTGRLGSNVTMETPTCLLYTHVGSVPNLSTDVKADIDRLPPVHQTTVPTVISSQDTLAEYEKGLASFTGQPDTPLYLSVQDPMSPCPSGYNERTVVSVWSTGGRVKSVTLEMVPWIDFLASTDNKRDFCLFLSNALMAAAPSEKTLVVGGGFVDETDVQSSDPLMNRDLLQENHEEADMRILLHCIHSDAHTIIVSARDTDILVLLLAHFKKMFCLQFMVEGWYLKETKLSPESYMSLVELCQPMLFEALSDGDTPQGCSTKRIRKAVDRTVNFLDTCIEKLNASEKLKSATILGVVQGGDMISQRKWCAKEVAQRPVAGVVLDGLHHGAMEESARWSLLVEILKEIPESHIRVLPRAGRPDEILKAVQNGIDVFDSSFPHQVSERGCALVFSFQPTSTTCVRQKQEEPTAVSQSHTSSNSSNDESQTASASVSQTNTSTNSSNDKNNTKCAKNIKHSEGDESEGIEEKTIYEIDLRDVRYFDDFQPVLAGCDCYCCQNHTRAYINHLLNTKELLAMVLLTVHNLHHYFAFFQAIRDSLANGTFEKLGKTIANHR